MNVCHFKFILHEDNRGFQIRGHVDSTGDPLILIMFEVDVQFIYVRVRKVL